MIRTRIRSLHFFGLAALALGILIGCAGTLPGGNDTVNRNFYESPAALKAAVAELKPGMSKGEAFARLGRVETHFILMNRDEVVSAIFGGRNTGVPTNFGSVPEQKEFLESLEGYKMTYRALKRKHGFTSPIRIQTDKSGFDYTLLLVFSEGVLLQNPLLSGGIVQKDDSNTIFDYLNPGTILNKTIE